MRGEELPYVYTAFTGLMGDPARRLYTITAQGRAALAGARGKVRELFGEFFESDA